MRGQFLGSLDGHREVTDHGRGDAHDLRDFVAFLDSRSGARDAVSLEDIGKFVAWLRLPRPARSGQVLPLPWLDGDLLAATVNSPRFGALVSLLVYNGVRIDEALFGRRWRLQLSTGSRRSAHHSQGRSHVD